MKRFDRPMFFTKNTENPHNSYYILCEFGHSINVTLNRGHAFNQLIYCVSRFSPRATHDYCNRCTGNSYDPFKMFELHMLVTDCRGYCTEHTIYRYDIDVNIIVSEKCTSHDVANTFVNERYRSSEYNDDCFCVRNQCEVNCTKCPYNFRQNSRTNLPLPTLEPRDQTNFVHHHGVGVCTASNTNHCCNSFSSTCTPSTLPPVLPASFKNNKSSCQASSNPSKWQQTKTTQNSNQTTDDLENEMVKLTELISNVSEKNTSDVANELENIYEGVQEEAELDCEINAVKKQIDDKLNSANEKYRESLTNTDFSDSDSNSSTSTDSDENETKTYFNEKRKCITTKSSQNNEKSQIQKNQEEKKSEQFKELIEARNVLYAELEKQEQIVNKANELLKEDLFKKRCDDQMKRKQDEDRNEKLSIFESDKDTYLKIKAKVIKGILKDTNVTPLFNQKYQIIKFMEINKVISFTSNTNVKEELYVFDQLLKVIESFEYQEDECENDYCPIDDIDKKYLPLCEKFLALIEKSEVPIMSDRKVHDILNSNSEIRKEIFKEQVDQTVFEKDIDKDEYANKEKNENKQ